MKCSHSITLKERETDFFFCHLICMFTKKVKKQILKDSIRYGIQGYSSAEITFYREARFLA